MPIAPPSQIGLDMMRAPALPEIGSARAGLTRRPDETAATEFSLAASGGAEGKDTAKTASSESFKRFEAMVLQTFIQNMLPKDGAAVYGKGMAGDMWKSLLAEKMAEVMSERGGIGIADRMLGGHYPAPADGAGADSGTAATFVPEVGAPAGEKPGLLIAPAILDHMQRQLSDLLASETTSGQTTILSTTASG